MSRSSFLKYPLACAFFLLLSGCNSPRDLPTDPENTPIVIPANPVYDAQQGTVSIQWDYLGVKPVARYRLLRLERDGIHSLNWVEVTPSRETTERADVWKMESVDTLINAGENYTYLIHTETALKKTAEEGAGEVQIPGAYIGDIKLNVAQGKATIIWHNKLGAPRTFTLFRQVDENPIDQLFQTESTADTLFVDQVTRGNHRYSYWLKNDMDHNIVLNSRTMQLLPYIRNPNYDVVAQTGAQVALAAPGLAFEHPMFMLEATSGVITLQQLDFFGRKFSPIPLDIPNRANLNLKSLSLAVTHFGLPKTPRILLAGVLPAEKRVQLTSFTLLGDTAVEAPWDAAGWPVDDPETPTAVAVANDGPILVFAGTTLKLYPATPEEIGTAQNVDLNLPAPVHRAVTFNNGIWVILTDGSAWRASRFWNAQGIASAPQWEAIGAAGDQAVGLSGNGTIAFVIDNAQHQIRTFDFEGHPGLWWEGLDDLDLSDGILSIATSGDVYLCDAAGRMAVFQNTFVQLAPIEQEGQ